MIFLRANPLAPVATPLILVGMPIKFFIPIYAAHMAAIMTAQGIPITIKIPESTTTTTAEAWWTYYNQGVQYGTSLPSLIPGNAMQTLQAPAPQLYEPENFDGTCTNYSKFMIKLILVFSSHPTHYSADTPKITYAPSYLSGSVADWFELHRNRATGQVSFTICKVFIHSLRNAYNDLDTPATTERNLHNLKQGDKDCSAYHTEFSTYATILNYDNRTKISFFSNGCN